MVKIIVIGRFWVVEIVVTFFIYFKKVSNDNSKNHILLNFMKNPLKIRHSKIVISNPNTLFFFAVVLNHINIKVEFYTTTLRAW